MTRPTISAMLAMAERLRQRRPLDTSADDRLYYEAVDMLAALAQSAPLSVPAALTANEVLQWMQARPGASWVASIADVEKAIAALEEAKAALSAMIAAAPDIRSERMAAPGTASAEYRAHVDKVNHSTDDEINAAIRTEGTKEEEA